MTLIISCNRASIPTTDELFEVEKAFSLMSEEKGMVEAFNSFCHEEGVLLRANNYPIVGKDHISDALSDTPDSLFTLTWKPSEARISESGDLGYTYGIYTLSYKDDPSASENGTYVTIWLKDEDDNWKFVMDTGQEGLQ